MPIKNPEKSQELNDAIEDVNFNQIDKEILAGYKVRRTNGEHFEIEELFDYLDSLG